MKRILITGMNSYIGNAVERYLMEYNARQGREHYRVDKLSLRGEDWERYAMGSYDAIIHVAGLAHADVGRVSEEEKELYYKINTELTCQVAQKAKEEGVSQFIYLSSVIVYGDSAPLGKTKHITASTMPKPAGFYGDSKLQAERRLQDIAAMPVFAPRDDGKPVDYDRQRDAQQTGSWADYDRQRDAQQTGDWADDDRQEAEKVFQVAIVRMPMVYGKGCKGNFPVLEKMAEKLPVFPNVMNERSMLYVENLAEFLRLLIEMGKGGLFFPQNAEYVTTAQLVAQIAEAKGRKIKLLSVCNPLVNLCASMPGKIGAMTHKAFGSLTIDKKLSIEKIDGYQIYSLQESIRKMNV